MSTYQCSINYTNFTKLSPNLANSPPFPYVLPSAHMWTRNLWHNKKNSFPINGRCFRIHLNTLACLTPALHNPPVSVVPLLSAGCAGQPTGHINQRPKRPVFFVRDTVFLSLNQTPLFNSQSIRFKLFNILQSSRRVARLPLATPRKCQK